MKKVPTARNDEPPALREQLERTRRTFARQQKELEQARAAAQLDRVRYEELFEWAPEAYLVTDLYGAIIESNNAASSLLNTGRGGLRRKPLAVFVPRSELRDFIKRIVSIREGFAAGAFTLQLVPRAKRPLTVLVSVTRATGTEAHNTLRWILRDITEREQQREQIETLNRELEQRVNERTSELRHSLDALKRSEARLARALDIETVGVIFFDSASRITDCNDSFLRMAGFTREDLRSGLRWDKVTPRDWVEVAASAASEFLLSGRAGPYEREYLRKDGSRWWGLVAAQWLNETECVEFVLDVTDRKQAEQELALAQQKVETEKARRDLRRQLSVAEEQQRRRLARDLHDQLGQHLTAFSLVLERARVDAGDNSAAQKRLAQLSELAAVMTSDARSLALELRPPELDDVGLASAVESYITQWISRYGIPVDMEIECMEAAPSGEAATAIYRILQEAMTNIARHAAASRVSVILERPDDHVNLIVEDDGAGFDVEVVVQRATRNQRFGLAGMHERVELVGGELTIESRAGSGTTVFAKVPVST